MNVGNLTYLRSDKITNETVKSCGCHRVAMGKIMGPKNRKIVLPKNPSLRSAKDLLYRRYTDKGMKKEDEIKIDDFLLLTKGNCFYCNREPFTIYNWAKNSYKKSSQYAKDNADYIYNGLDRIDSSKGHTLDNVVPCCKHCNYAKRERSLQEFVDWVLRICTKHNL